MKRTPALAGVELQGRLGVQDLKAFALERAAVGRLRLGEASEGPDTVLDQGLTMLSPRTGNEAEMVVSDAAPATLGRERTDRAVGHGLGSRSQAVTQRRRARELPRCVPIERWVATQIDFDRRAVAEDDVGERRLPALNVGEEAVVEG